MARVFLSSVITGFEQFRETAAEAIATLGHQVIRSEDFGVRPDTPQRACLAELRSADVVVLLLGARYGFINPRSGLSATHEEFREAAETKLLLVFLQRDAELEEAQALLVKEAQDWSGGSLTGSFSTSDELRRMVTRALHDWELSQASGPADPDEMRARGGRLIPEPRSSSGGKLAVVAAPGPRQELVRPARWDSAQFREQLLAFAQNASIFDKFERTDVREDSGRLFREQASSSLHLDSTGAICVSQRATIDDGRKYLGIATLVEEDLRTRIERAFRLLADILDDIDPTHRCPSVIVAGALVDAAWMPWKTASQHQADPNSATMGRGGDLVVVAPSEQALKRAALRAQAGELAADLTARFRREVLVT